MHLILLHNYIFPRRFHYPRQAANSFAIDPDPHRRDVSVTFTDLLCEKYEDSIPGSRTCQSRDLDYSRKMHHRRSTFPFAISLFVFPLTSLRGASCRKFYPRGQRPRYRGKLLRLRVSSSSVLPPPAARRVSAFLPLHHRLFIIARWYQARETALCCNTSPPARSCYRNPSRRHRSARHRRRPPPLAGPPGPYVCLDASRHLCRRPSTSSSHGFYSGERIAVVICIWKSIRTGALWSVSVLLSISRGSSSLYV